MVSLDKAILATYDREGKHFELYVDPDAAYAYLEGIKKDIKNILVAEEVYEDAKKGENAKASDVQKAFGTTDIMNVLEFILKNGEVQLTTEQKRKKQEERRKQILAILLRESIDPRTNAPHTPTRMEAAFEEARILVDPFKDAREQIPDIIKKLRPLLPLKFEKMLIAIKIPAAFAHRAYGTLKGMGMKREEWTKGGDLVCVVEIFGGEQGEFYDKLNKMTGGQVETRVLGEK
jgi:ribosome maturation protein SDO1